MPLTMNKATTDLISMLKKEKFPKQSKKTFWNILNEQLDEDGTWDDDLMDKVKELVGGWLAKQKKSELKNLWEESETAAEDYADEDMPDNETAIDLLSEELLDLVLNKMDDPSPQEEFYTPGAASGKKKFDDDDDDFDTDLKDDIFSDDDIEDFGADDYFADDRF